MAQLVKNLPGDSFNAETWLDPWVGKIPWRRERLPTPVFWPREFHGLYSPRSRKESDTTEQLSLHFLSQTLWVRNVEKVKRVLWVELWPLPPQKKIRYNESLIPSISECDLIWKYCLYRGDQVNVRSLKVKVSVTQSCPIPCESRDCSLPGSSIHGILQARILKWPSLLQGIFLTQGSDLGLLHCRQILYHLSYQGGPRSLGTPNLIWLVSL